MVVGKWLQMVIVVLVTKDEVCKQVLQVLTALAGGLIDSAVGSSVALPSSLINQVIEEELVDSFDTGSWIGQLCFLIFPFYFLLYQLQVTCMLQYQLVYLGEL